VRKFQFRLERVLGWRKTQLELEEHRLRQLSAELEAIERNKARLAAERTLAEHQLLSRTQLNGQELAAHSAYLAALHREEKQAERQRQQQQRLIEAQLQRVTEARRQCRLLERLKARAWNAWQAELDRETEALAAEAHLARWREQP
jgi:flagellar export protein FliJ